MEKGGIVCSMERIMAIYDVDQSYASRFADFVNQREKLPFTAVSFTSLEKLKEYAKSHSIEILLVSDEVRREVEDIEAGQVVALCDGEIVEMEEDWPAVYKYQSGDSLVREVLARYCVQPAAAAPSLFGEKGLYHRSLFSGEPLPENFSGFDYGAADGEDTESAVSESGGVFWLFQADRREL